MKLYMHPASTTSRPVRLFIAESGIDIDQFEVDLATGEQNEEPFVSINPHRLLPVLVDKNFRLTECSAILKFLADRINSPAYPKDLWKRAKVNEMMDWFNTHFYRDYCYGLVYPQIFPHHRRPTEEVQAANIAWAKERAEGWLQILNYHWIGPSQAYVFGDKITIADYFGICLITIGEVIRCDFSAYPNVKRWTATMKQLKSWPEISETLYDHAEAVEKQAFEAIF